MEGWPHTAEEMQGQPRMLREERGPSLVGDISSLLVGPAPSSAGVPGVTEPHCPASSAPPARCPAPVPEASRVLLAVGPPLLTLVNFEVENLAYMLVCMQWTVSGPCSGPLGTQLWWQGGVGCLGAAPVHECKQVCVCACNSGYTCVGREHV